MLPSAATHAEEVGAKICAPNMAAPQTDAYLALRHNNNGHYFSSNCFLVTKERYFDNKNNNKYALIG